MLTLFFATGKEGWLWIALGAAVLIIISLIYFLVNKKRKKDKRDKLKTQEGDFEKPLLNDRNEMFINLPRNVTFSVGENKTNPIKAGRYLLKSAIEGEKGGLNVRYNGLVKEFKSGDKITLGEGDSICCVSASAVLIADLD